MLTTFFSGWRAALAELEGYLASPDPERVEAGTKIILTKFLTLLSLPLLLVFAVHYLRRGMIAEGAIMLACTASNATAYAVIWGKLRRTAPPGEILAAFRVAALVFLVAWGTQHVLVVALRGRLEYAPWIVLFPYLALLILERRDAAVLLAAYLAAFAGLMLGPGTAVVPLGEGGLALLRVNLVLASVAGAVIQLLVVAVNRHALRSMAEVRRRLEDAEAQNRRAGEELQRARGVAEAASAAKTEFLARMSHEIRTPMNAVLGMTELLLHSGLDAAQRARAETIDAAGAELLHALDEILDLARIEANRLELECEPFEPGGLCREVADLFTAQAAGKGIALTCVVDHEVPPRVLGDPHRVGQVLRNLVSNAVRYTPRGEVAIRTSVAGGNLRFEVRDTGPGIPRELREHIFEEYARPGQHAAREPGGVGLGLAIARRLTGIMGGEIGVGGDAGRGALFFFTIPLRAASGPAEPRAGATPAGAGPARRAVSPSAPRRVLLAEDNRTNQELAKEMLELAGCTVDVVPDGRAAVAAAARTRYALILMDCEMPGLDGYGATAEIRLVEAARGGGARVPIVALTGHAMAGERERCLAAGMDDYLAKPFRLAQLHALVDRWAAGAGSDTGDSGRG